MWSKLVLSHNIKIKIIFINASYQLILMSVAIFARRNWLDIIKLIVTFWDEITTRDNAAIGWLKLDYINPKQFLLTIIYFSFVKLLSLFAMYPFKFILLLSMFLRYLHKDIMDKFGHFALHKWIIPQSPSWLSSYLRLFYLFIVFIEWVDSFYSLFSHLWRRFHFDINNCITT